MGTFDVTCCYCGDMFSLVEDDDYTDDLFQELENIERECCECGKKLSVEPNAIWSYTTQKPESDELNDL